MMAFPYMSVELVHGGSFTQEQADKNKLLVNPEVFPHLYGDELPPEIKIVQRSFLIRADSVETNLLGGINLNTARFGSVQDGNPKLPKIRTGISTFGFKLKHPSMAVFRHANGKIYKINGKTRFTILVDEWGYEWIIVDVYEANDGYSEDQVNYALHIFGQSANIEDDPKGDTSEEDLFHGCQYAIENGWIGLDVNGVPEWDSIEKHLKKVCRNNKLTPTTMSGLIARVIGQYDEIITGKRYWSSVKKVQEFITSGGNMNFKKITPQKDDNGNLIRKGIKYMVFETSEYRRAFLAATKWAHQNPDYEVRIIYYRQYMKAYDTATNWTETLERCVEHWNNSISEIKDVHFSSNCKRETDRCYIYGAVPSLKSMHDLSKLVFLDEDGDWSQK